MTSKAFKHYSDGNLFDATNMLMRDLPTACFETATLILSVAYPDKLPFFSPELTSYCKHAPDNNNARDEDMRTYEAILCLVKQTGTRIGLETTKMAYKVEKVAYVLRLIDSLRGKLRTRMKNWSFYPHLCKVLMRVHPQ